MLAERAPLGTLVPGKLSPKRQVPKGIERPEYLFHDGPEVVTASDVKNAETIEKILDVRDKAGNPSRVSAVYQAPQRDSFIAALKDVPEIWEIATDPKASSFSSRSGFRPTDVRPPTSTGPKRAAGRACGSRRASFPRMRCRTGARFRR